MKVKPLRIKNATEQWKKKAFSFYGFAITKSNST